MANSVRIRAPKDSTLAKTRRAFKEARRLGATVQRTIENGRHVYNVCLPINKRWIASGWRDLWIGGASYNTSAYCADIDCALRKIAKGVKEV